MPNTKTKKFDWQIFLAVSCILLVICCATVCCVIVNTEKGVARAADTQSFTVTSGLYIKNYNNATSDEIEEVITYYFGGVEGVLQSGASVDTSYNDGTALLTYTTTSNTNSSIEASIILKYTQMDYGGTDLCLLSLILGDNSSTLVSLMYDITNRALLSYSTITPVSTTINNNYFADFSASAQDNSYIPYYICELFLGSGHNASRIDSITFTYNSLALITGFISASDYFYIGPPPPTYDELQAEVNRLTGIIQEQRQEIQYYESLNLNMTAIPIFTIARCSPSTFEYNGVTYTSDMIERSSSGWDIYHSSYLNQELPENYGVGFSLFLVETLSNTKFDMSPLIQCWYNYTGATARLLGFSVGYRNQNGQIVKVGEFSSDLPAENEFFINAPTNELVFFREESNLMEVDDDFSIVMYQYDLESIYNDAYNDGIQMGMLLGRQEGYNQGVLAANDYSFFSLFTSVFDAPITAIVGKWGDSDGDGIYQREGGMLNFYIPGLDINFAPFLLSLFTIGIIVLIIRFILARKS